MSTQLQTPVSPSPSFTPTPPSHRLQRSSSIQTGLQVRDDIIDLGFHDKIELRAVCICASGTELHIWKVTPTPHQVTPLTEPAAPAPAPAHPEKQHDDITTATTEDKPGDAGRVSEQSPLARTTSIPPPSSLYSLSPVVPQDTIFTSLILSKQFSYEDRITCVASIAPPPHTTIRTFDASPSTDPSQSGIPFPSLVTGHADGRLTVWCQDTVGDRVELKEMARVQAYDNASVADVKMSTFGRFATTSSSCAPSSTSPTPPTVKIWEMESNAPNIELEYIIPFKHSMAPSSGEEKDQQHHRLYFDWHRLDDGQHLLALAYGAEVRILVPAYMTAAKSASLYDDSSETGAANESTFFNVRYKTIAKFEGLPYTCTSLRWSNNGSGYLWVGAGNFLFIFHKWNEGDSSAPLTLYENGSSSHLAHPPYHPRVLMQFLAAGNQARVDAVLKHLERAFRRYEKSPTQDRIVHVPVMPIDHLLYGAPLSEEDLLTPPSIGKEKYIGDEDEDEDDDNNEEVKDPAGASESDDFWGPASERKYNALREYDEDATSDGAPPSSSSSSTSSGISSALLEYLSEMLSNISLPGVDSKEQMFLLAILDTVKRIKETQGALDLCGARFLLAAKIFSFLNRNLNAKSAAQQSSVHLPSSELVWALHSESQETLIQNVLPQDATWGAARTLGVGLWLTNPTTLRVLVERIAKVQFLEKKDPADCALFYMALKKKGALVAMYKTVNDVRLVDFLSKDFSDPKYMKAAMTNAFALSGKHRYEYAAAFFLLAGQVKEATTTLIQRQGDWQLALVVARLFEGEGGPTYRFILGTYVLANAGPSGSPGEDVHLKSAVLWLLKRHHDALSVLVSNISSEESGNQSTPPLSNVSHTKEPPTGVNQRSIDPSTLHFYNYLRGHTQLKNYVDSRGSLATLVRKTLYTYTHAGCGLLGVDLVHTLLDFQPRIASASSVAVPIVPVSSAAEQQEQHDELGLYLTQPSRPNEDDSDDFGFLSAPKKAAEPSDDFDFLSTPKKASEPSEDFDFLSAPRKAPEPADDFDFLSTPKAPAAPSDDFDFLSAPSSGNNSASSDNNKIEDTVEPVPADRYHSALFPFVDASLSSQVVLQILVQQVEDIRGAKSWTTAKGLLFQNFECLTQKTDSINSASILRVLIRFTFSRQYLRECYDLMQYASSRSDSGFAPSTLHPYRNVYGQALLLNNVARDLLEVADLAPTNQISATQAAHIRVLAKDLFACFEASLGGLPRSRSSSVVAAVTTSGQAPNPETLSHQPHPKQDNQLIITAVYLSLFIAAWVENKFELLAALSLVDSPALLAELARSESVPVPVPTTDNEDANNSGGDTDEEDDDDDEKARKEAVRQDGCAYLRRVLKFLLLHKFVENFVQFIQGPSTLSFIQQISPKLHAELGSHRSPGWVSSGRTIGSLSAWSRDTQACIGTPPVIVVQSSVLDAKARPKSPKQTSPSPSTGINSNLGVLLDAAHRIKHLPREERVVWEIFARQDVDHSVLEQEAKKFRDITSALLEAKSKKSAVRDEFPIKFGPEVELYRSPELMQSFCLNPCDNTYMALASTKAMKEIDLKQVHPVEETDSHISHSQDDHTLSHNNSVGVHFLKSASQPNLTSLERAAIQQHHQQVLHREATPTKPYPPSTLGMYAQGVASHSHERKKSLSSLPFRNLKDVNRGGIFKSALHQMSTASPLSHSAAGPSSFTSYSNLSSSSSSVSLSSSSPAPNVVAGGASGAEGDKLLVVGCVHAHPHYPYYISGGLDGSVCLWQFDVPDALVAYRLPPNPRVIKCKFNQSGTKFGVCDVAGYVSLWKFSASADPLRPFHTFQAHTKQTHDMIFLNSGSLIATAGISPETKKSVCIWDLLMPSHKAQVSSMTSTSQFAGTSIGASSSSGAGLQLHERDTGASCLAFSSRHNTLVCGGKKGGLYMFDLRANRTLAFIPRAHTLNVKTLSMDPSERFVATGSSDGHIKIWDLATCSLQATFEDVHKKQTFVRPGEVFQAHAPVSTYGVIDMEIAGDSIYSTGADGRVVKRPFMES
eukprot:TRINITY_DN1180_c1_g1_i5.p1 TRINITY_DN1180_c1_g1~~TRINITY_DN1180_c1_g1_i5.p1  ORF type:complete len:2044 (-),score=317.30 TRINITY_DN1180_c1_g1_i5:1-6111(-)